MSAAALPAQVFVFERGQAPSMSVSAKDLEDRLALVTESATVKGVLCNAVLGAVESLLDHKTALACRAASGERRFIDFFTYSIRSFLKLSFTAAELSRSKLGGYDAAFRTLGKQAVNDFLSTAAGKTLRSLGSRDPHRLLATLPSTYRAALNHGERHAQLAGEHRCVLKMRGDYLPHPYHEGVLGTMLSSLGLGPVQVMGRRVGVLDVDYEITWD